MNENFPGVLQALDKSLITLRKRENPIKLPKKGSQGGGGEEGQQAKKFINDAKALLQDKHKVEYLHQKRFGECDRKNGSNTLKLLVHKNRLLYSHFSQ